MTHVPHELAADFPEHADRIHELKTRDRHFAQLAEAYHRVNREVHRMETRVEPVSDRVEEQARRERMRLKDEIARYLGRPTS